MSANPPRARAVGLAEASSAGESGGCDVPPEPAAARLTWHDVALLIAILVLSFAARWPFRTVPLIRDEAEYVQMGQQILRGAVPYRDIYNQKSPFVPFLMAAVQWLAPQSLSAVRLATTAYGLLTLSVVFLGARHFFGRGVAFWSTLALEMMLFGQCGAIHPANTEFFQMLWVVLAVWCWIGAASNSAWPLAIAAGASVAMAYQSKQTAIAVVAYFLIDSAWVRWALWRNARPGERWIVTRIIGALLGFALVTALVLGYFRFQGALYEYVECTWTNNFQYVGMRYGDPLHVLRVWYEIIADVAAANGLMWLFGAAGFFLLARTSEESSRFSGLWLLFACQLGMSLTTGAPYRHYYVPVVFPLAIAAGVAMTWLVASVRAAADKPIRRSVLIGVAILVWIIPLAKYARDLANPRGATDRVNAMRPFTDAAPIGEYLRERTSDDEPILVVGSEPELYYRAMRPSATRMLIMYPLTGPYSYSQRLQEQFLNDISNGPNYVVLVRQMQTLSEFDYEGLAKFYRDVLSILDQYYFVEAGIIGQEPIASSDPRFDNAVVLIYRRRAGL